MLRFIYCQPLGPIILALLMAPLLWALLKNLLSPRHSLLWRRLNLLLAGVSVLVILYATLVSRTGGTRQLILTPFASFAEATVQPELYRSMLMNVLLFVPLGLSLSQALPFRRPWLRFFIPVAGALCLSIAAEALQYLFALGQTEVDDVLMNTLGAMWGACALPISRGLQRLRTHKY